MIFDVSPIPAEHTIWINFVVLAVVSIWLFYLALKKKPDVPK